MSESKSYAVGQEIEAMCGKCKDATVHVIEVIKSDKPYKALCKSCNSSHRYRSPDLETKTTTKKSSTTKKTATKAASKTPEQRKWTRLCNKVDTDNPEEYEMTKSFTEHDAINHAKFGLGVVKEIVNNSKMSVVFEDGERVLVQNR